MIPLHLFLLVYDQVALGDTMKEHGHDVGVLMEGRNAMGLDHVTNEGLCARLRAQESLHLVDFGVQKDTSARALRLGSNATVRLDALVGSSPRAFTEELLLFRLCGL